MLDHFKIFDYWKDKVICKDGKVIIDTQKHSTSKSVLVVQDWGEPMCWACGCPIIGEYEKNNDITLYEADELKFIWNDPEVKSHLNRCHILAKQFNGPDTAENLFLMCESCHIESPDTKNRDAFMRWIYNKRKTHIFGMNLEEQMQKILTEIKTRGYRIEDIAKNISEMGITSQDIMNELQNNVGLHGGHISQSSMIIGYVDTIEKLIEKKQSNN